MNIQTEVETPQNGLWIVLLLCSITTLALFILALVNILYIVFAPILAVSICGGTWGMVCLNTDPGFVNDFYATFVSAFYLGVLSVLLFCVVRMALTTFYKRNYMQTKQLVAIFVLLLFTSSFVYFLLAGAYRIPIPQ